MSLFRAPRSDHPYLAGAPLLMAHRGGAALAPENTMEAFRIAVERWGADVLEMDVRLSRDGEVVVIHDPTVDRTTDGAGRVEDLTWEELAELDAGFRFLDLEGRPSFRGKGVRIPRFSEVLEAFPAVRLNVEAKDSRVAYPLVGLIRRHQAERRVLVAAERERNRRRVRGYPGPWGSSRRQVALFLLSHRFPGGGPYIPGADALQVPEIHRGIRIVTPRFVQQAHRKGLAVHVWTVNDPADMVRLLSWGVDGIQTDRPDLLAAVLVKAVGRPPPPGLR